MYYDQYRRETVQLGTPVDQREQTSRARRITMPCLIGGAAVLAFLGTAVEASNMLSDAINPPAPQIGCYVTTPQNGMMPDGRHRFTESGVSVMLGFDQDYIPNLNESKVNPQALTPGTRIGVPDSACNKAQQLFPAQFEPIA